VTGGGGLSLSVAEGGNPDGPAILFVHGFCQAIPAWRRQFESALAREYRLVALDLRGHGGSDKPESAYLDGRLWADDLHAVITELRLSRPVVVGWSYGGVVVSDYLRHHGHSEVAGVNLVGALMRLGKPEFYADFGPDFLQILPGMVTPDAAQTRQAQELFVSQLCALPLEGREREEVFAYNAAVPLHVRVGIAQRVEDHSEVLRGLKVPVLVTYGVKDRLVVLEAAQRIAALAPRAELSLYPEAGHSPFWEDAPRFNQELARFVGKCR